MSATPGDNANAARSLVVAPAWVGDMVMADTLIQVLKSLAPNTEIDVLAPPVTAPLARRMAGITDVHVLEVGHGELGLRRRWQVGRRLAEKSYAQCYLLPNSLKSALVPWFAGIPRRTGWLGESRYGLVNDWRKLDQARYPLMIERFMALAYDADTPLEAPYPKPSLVADADRAEALVRELKLELAGEGGGQVIALCPGAEFGPAKQWPVEHYAQVAEYCANRGDRVWLMGSAKDASVCEAIQQQAGSARVSQLAGKTSLLDAVDLLSLADTVVCNDSGLMHVAAAMGCRVVAVYGSTSPDFTPPLSTNASVVRLGLSCSPCFSRTCPLGHLDCLRKLSADRVIAEL